METTVVRYKVKADRAEENREYIRKVFQQLDEGKPEGLRYVSFNLDDGLSFVHIAVVETDDGKNPLPDISTFQAPAATRDGQPHCDLRSRDFYRTRRF